MSFGYETQIPLINTITFYNAIANNGQLVKPRFIKAIRRRVGTDNLPDGQMQNSEGDEQGQWMEAFPPETLIPQICKPQTLKQIQDALFRVVNQKNDAGKLIGTGNPVAGSPALGETDPFHISGKTGTAQVLYGKGATFNGYLLSFCGYFPSEQPRYTMLVAIQTKGGLASGGIISGGVFKKIARRIYAQGLLNS
jgi:cell division protein FtsI (penicillin-binding protein 3)